MPASEPPDLGAQLGWLFARQRFGMVPGLERVRALLSRLGDPQRAFDAVLVGGTNGKGSCASTLASILTASGHRTGLFTSPHLTHFGERFLVDGVPLSDEDLLTGISAVRPSAEALGATFFEIVTALACLLFARAGVRLAVMEVGLGGRLDATNVLSPRLSVVTGVALDHTEVLGETVAEIAAEKAGIMRPAVPTLTGATGEALGVLRAAADALETPLWALGEEIAVEAEDLGWSGVRCTVRSPLGRTVVMTPLLGLHQAGNVALACVVAQVLGASAEEIGAGVARTRWPGRLEPLPFGGRTFLLDGAHNPQAAAALAAALARLGVAPVRLIFGTSEDKDVAEIIAALEPAVAEVILTRARLSPRAAPPVALEPHWSVPTFVTDTPEEALALALTLTAPGEIVVAAGSLYLIGELRPLVLGDTPEQWARLQ